MKKKGFFKKMYRSVQKLKKYFDPLYIVPPQIQVDLGRKS